MKLGEPGQLSLPLAPTVSLVGGIVIWQRDLGTTIILCGTVFMMLFVAGVHTGMFRYLLLAFPLGLLLIGSPNPAAVPRRRAALVVVLSVISLALQVPWVTHALVVTPLAGNPWLP